MDLGYKKEHARKASLADLNQDFEHLLNNRRTKPTVFKDMNGYIAKREYTEKKGPHIHALFIYDGHKVGKDAYKADQIGEYWKNEITNGNGLYHNCNREKEKYEDCALGMIDHTDTTKRAVLNEKAVSYLCKERQTSTRSSNPAMSDPSRAGLHHEGKSNAGRPRQRNSCNDVERD